MPDDTKETAPDDTKETAPDDTKETAPDDGTLNTPQAWAAKHKAPPHFLAGLLVHAHWVAGDEITEAAYLAGAKAFGELELR